MGIEIEIENGAHFTSNWIFTFQISYYLLNKLTQLKTQLIPVHKVFRHCKKIAHFRGSTILAASYSFIQRKVWRVVTVRMDIYVCLRISLKYHVCVPCMGGENRNWDLCTSLIKTIILIRFVGEQIFYGHYHAFHFHVMTKLQPLFRRHQVLAKDMCANHKRT